MDDSTASVATAERLWTDLRSSLVNTERTIVEIIAAKAWEPLGYESFAQAWAERMSGVRLATDVLRVHTLYALFDSGIEDDEVRVVLGPMSGISHGTVENVRRQWSHGVPPDLATTVRVRPYERALPSEPRTVRVELNPDEFARFSAMAERIGSSVKSESEKAIRVHFDRLACESQLSV